MHARILARFARMAGDGWLTVPLIHAFCVSVLCSTVVPHSVQSGELPMGYPHFTHRPRLVRRTARHRRTTNGAANITHKTAA